MGTRNLTVVVKDKKIKVAQYGQWDGYPSGVGKDIANFIQKKMDLRKFKKALDNSQFISDEEITALWKKAGADDSGLVNMIVSQKFNHTNPALSRETGASVLEIIQETGGAQLQNSIDFAGDSLFCEWAYVIDLDKKVVEVYQGFNKTPLKKRERFYKYTNPASANGGYYPVKLLAKYPFRSFTVSAMTKLEKSLNNEE